MHGPIFNRKGDQVGYVEGDWAIDRSGEKRWLVDGAKLLDPKTLEVVGHLTDAGKINPPQDKSPAGNDDPADRLFLFGAVRKISRRKRPSRPRTGGAHWTAVQGPIEPFRCRRDQ
jgi:hypothetical protein